MFKTKLIQKIMSWALMKGHIKWLPYIYKYLPKDWRDHKGNNFFHFSAKHHNMYLFEVALFNEADINGIDSKGNAPIHRFIESCFISNQNQKESKEIKEDIIFDFDEKVLNAFLENKADVNQWIKNDKASGQWGQGRATYSKKNIMGSPIEVLIDAFWEHIITPSFDNEDILKKYNQVYSMLSNGGAKINLIVDTGEFFDLSNETTIDAMQITSSVIVSHFFIKYISNKNDLNVIYPLLNDPKVSFSLADDSGNTLLHHFFGQLTKRYDYLQREKVQELLLVIFNNPSFHKKHLEMNNTFRISPIKCLKDKAIEYADYLEKLMLSRRLEENLTLSETKKPKRHKI